MAINFNTDPYWDDYETPGLDGLTPKEKYNRILFRPGVPLQARELTQLQTSLQHQISAIGDNVFTEGSMIIPGGVTNHVKCNFVQLDSDWLSSNGGIENFLGQDISGSANSAKVIHVVAATDIDPATLYIQYKSGDGTFVEGESITATDGSNFVIGQSGMEQTTGAAESVGFGSLVMIENGIYYIRKHFVVVQSGSVVVSKYDHNVTMDVGFIVREELVGPGDDVTLNDNAIGTPNITAPGAHRLSIVLELTSQTPGADTSNFILLSRIEFGKITSTVLDTDYGLLEKTLARRTYDESGSYSVNPVIGTFKSSTVDEDEFVTLGINPCKAYVHGHETEILSTLNKEVAVSFDSELATNQKANINPMSYIIIDSTEAIVHNMQSMPLYGDPISFKLTEDGGLGDGTAEIGTARFYQMEEEEPGKARLYFFNYKPDISGASLSLHGSLEDIPDNFTSVTIKVGDGNMGTNAYKVLSYELVQDSSTLSLPHNNIFTHDVDVDDATQSFNYNYEVIKNFEITLDGSGNGVITTNITGESFVDLDSNDWLMSVHGAEDGGVIHKIENLSYNNDNVNEVSISMPSLFEKTCYISCPVSRTASHKTKSFIPGATESFITNNAGTPVDFTGWTDLSVPDVIEISKVEIVHNVTDEVIQDVTSEFLFDNGQTYSSYNISKFKIDPSSNYYTSVLQNGPDYDLKLTYDYFSHAGSGDFFVADSYTVGYEDIPLFDRVPLNDVVDFRFIKDATTTEYKSAKAPRINSTFSTNLQYYLPRIDKVVLDDSATITVIEGIASLTPSIPDDIPGAMTVLLIGVPPRTSDPSKFKIKNIDNKRYTMRDIGSIENRVNRLEYYGTLNLLENIAQNEQIFADDGSGLTRFKSGFVVDSFVNSKVAGVNSSEFQAAIDHKHGICRPTFEESNVNLIKIPSTSTIEHPSGIVTLPYTEVASIVQNKSSNIINVNPYEVFNWNGTLNLSPSSDEWKSIIDLPDLIIPNSDGEYDAMLADMKSNTKTGNIWNEWETNWTGRTATIPSEFLDLANTTKTVSGNGQVPYSKVRSRTGTLVEIVPETITVSDELKEVKVDFIPFMRSRLVNCNLSLCRPNTTLYPFFDGTPVDLYCSTGDTADVNVEVSALAGLSQHPTYTAENSILRTDVSGKLEFSFWVPNRDDLKFATGKKEFLLTDSAGNIADLTTTSAVADYSAEGLRVEQRLEIVTTRVPKIVRTELGTQTRITTKYWDPLAQTFILKNLGGGFVTSIDLHFVTTPTAENDPPVTVSIREVLNGYPTQTEIPFGECTLSPSEVSTTAPTNFKFSAPVYLKEDVEYSFVILSNSNEYNVKYGMIGERDTDTNHMIQGQPYTGVMFKSSNSSTWTPMQDSDLRFTINTAVFDPVGNIDLIPATVPPVRLSINPFTTTASSNDVWLNHKGHGLKEGDLVTFNLVDNISIPNNTVAYIEREEGFATTGHTDNGYYITVDGLPGLDGNWGGNKVCVSGNIIWNTIYPYITQLALSGTEVKWSLTSTHNEGNAMYTEEWPIDINANYTPTVEQTIMGNLSGVINNGIRMSGVMSTTADNISPIVDLERCSHITIANNINDDSTNEDMPDLGMSHAKYVTKEIVLDSVSDDIKIWMDVCRPSGSDVKVYTRSGTQTLESSPWLETAHSGIPNTGIDEFEEVLFRTNGIESFSVFSVKVVFLSPDTSRCPQIKNLRAIAVI